MHIPVEMQDILLRVREISSILHADCEHAGYFIHVAHTRIYGLSGSLARQASKGIKLAHHFVIQVPKTEKSVVKLFLFWEEKWMRV